MPLEISLESLALKIYYLKSSCNNLKGYLHKIGKDTDGLCNECKVVEDVPYFMLHCVKYKNSRITLQNRLKFSKEQMTLANIFQEKQNLIHIISYIQESGIK